MLPGCDARVSVTSLYGDLSAPGRELIWRYWVLERTHALTDVWQAWERWFVPVAQARWSSAAWHTLAWAIFGGAYVGAGRDGDERERAGREIGLCIQNVHVVGYPEIAERLI